MKTFSGKQVTAIVMGVIVGISFVETSLPIWTLEFWREFILKVIIYCVVSFFVVFILGQTKLFKDRNDS